MALNPCWMYAVLALVSIRPPKPFFVPAWALHPLVWDLWQPPSKWLELWEGWQLSEQLHLNDNLPGEVFAEGQLRESSVVGSCEHRPTTAVCIDDWLLRRRSVWTAVPLERLIAQEIPQFVTTKKYPKHNIHATHFAEKHSLPLWNGKACWEQC